MPPKKGKGKKVNDDDDAYWEAKAAKSTPAVAPKPAADESEDEAPAPAKGTGFAALALEDDDEAGGGGLMAALAKSSKKKDKKKNKRVEDDFDGDAPVDGEEAAPAVDTAPQVVGDDEWPEEDTKKSKKGKKDKKGKKSKQQDDDEDLSEQVSALAIDGESTPTAAVPEPEIQAVGDDEWPEEDVKPKKGKGGKKGGKKSKAQDEEDEEVAPAAPAAEAAASPAVEDEGDDEPAAGEVKILSKKEKEKLKKEKEKAKKKAQLAAKKATTADDSPAPPSPSVESTPTPASTPAADVDADEDDDAEGGAGGDKKKNKKKKKKTTAPAEEAPAAKAKPLTGRMAAIKAAMEEKKRLEEEAAKKAEEERKRIEEEDARLAEQERMAEEIKQKKKEKEKAKKELAKKEGRLLTPKQRQEKAAAEARLQALLASGVKIEGLQKDDGETAEEAPKPKKVVYGNKKKKGPAPKVEEKKEERPKVEEVKKVAEAKDDEDDWDKSDKEEEVAKPKEEEKKKDESDGDDWDVSSEEEEEAKPEPVKAPEPKPTPAAPAKSAAPSTSKSAPSAAKPTNGKKAMPAAAVAEESSEEDSDSDDDSDSDSDSDSEDASSEEDSSDDEVVLTPAQRKIAAKQAEDERLAAQKKKEARELREKRHEQAMAARSKEDLRSPICCILGHVDTGKTKLLDKIRQTNVQEGEAGGITQQIGATYFPVEAIKTKTEVLNKDGKNEYKIPGLLIIDTPGHESFSNLRTRGSSLCNIAILVVDLMHGLEPQTLESLKLLRDKKTPFIVALNKIDRIYGWKATPNGAFQESLAGQTNQVKREFADRVEKTILAFAEQGMNSCLYYDNKNLGRNVSLVPTSAITGEGIPDMIMLLVNLTQQRMAESLMYISELECTVLEVKVIEGLGTTIDVVLSNGYLREGDRIVVCGLNGPIYTNVRALLTPQPLREMRIKSAYVHHKEVKAALGVKITAPDLEKAIAGSRLLVVGPDDDEEDLGDEVMADLKNLLSWVDKSGRGVSVQASTLGSLEALLDFLKVSKIPVSTINIGPVHKRDVIQASTMLEKAKELACMLCFDVPVDKDAEALADSLGVRLFKADIIYHLFDKFTAYNKSVVEERKAEAAAGAFWPCRLKILQTFARRDPIVLGVDILDGTLRVGTPLCVVKVEVDKTTTPPTSTKTIIDIGRITSIEKNHETFTKLSRKNIGAGAAIKVEAIINQAKLAVGRHFDESDELYSHVTRNSIDVLKEHFRSEAEPSDWALIKKLKPLLDIP